MIVASIDKSLEKKSLLITGATGFVGRNLLDLLVNTDSYRSGSLKLTCVTRDAVKLYSQWPTEKSRLKVLNWDIRKPLTERQPDFDYVFHLAGENRGVNDLRQAKVILDTSILGTQNLLRATATEKINTPKIIIASSGAVYEASQNEKQGFREPSEISEKFIEDDDPYRSGKSTAESICRQVIDESTTQIVVARMFAFVGPHLPLNLNFAVGNFFRDCLLNRAITINSDGKSIRSYQFAADMANWLVTILLNGKNANIYNIGSSEQISIVDLANRICNIFENKHGVKILGDQSPDPVSSFYVPNIEKAEKELGLTNSFSLNESLLAMRQFLQHHKPT
jgi:dTDP-glucose 4,6-dehydratase